MKRFAKYYNEDYARISYYAVRTVMTIFILGLIVYYLAGKTGAAISFVSAVFKPLVLGLALTYLLSPLAAKLEKRLFASIKKPGTARLASVLLTFAIVLAVLFFILVTVLALIQLRATRRKEVQQ